MGIRFSNYKACAHNFFFVGVYTEFIAQRLQDGCDLEFSGASTHSVTKNIYISPYIFILYVYQS